jgi:DnaJ-class molecular chaperone
MGDRSMTTPTAKPWDYHSGVYHCETCEGTGVIASCRRATIDDPYPEDDCNDCEGVGHGDCKVCGFAYAMMGYDCFVCATVEELPRSAMPNEVSKAVALALEARNSGVR